MTTINTSQQAQDAIKEAKRLKLEAIRDYHAKLIEKLGISPYDFNMKMPFHDKHRRMVVGIFQSEFKKEKGFYFELVTRELDPSDPQRKVYKISPNPFFADEYEQNEKGSFLVPVEQLMEIWRLPADEFDPEEPVKIKTYDAPAPMVDAPYSEMTIRDYMAIHTGKPVSTKEWLNELVKSTK